MQRSAGIGHGIAAQNLFSSAAPRPAGLGYVAERVHACNSRCCQPRQLVLEHRLQLALPVCVQNLLLLRVGRALGARTRAARHHRRLWAFRSWGRPAG